MSSDLSIQRSASAVEPALVINRILEAGVRKAPNQTITYNGRDYTYREFEERVHRLAGALAAQGIKPGDTVAVMDWDTNRYLEAFFAIPMMGAVLHTVNVRLSPEQILYTINHAKDDAILVNSEFLPVLEELKDRIEPVKTYILLDDDGVKGSDSLPLAGEYVRITVSCGLTEFTGNDSPASVFERADEALYRAKQGGRNCCIAA